MEWLRKLRCCTSLFRCSAPSIRSWMAFDAFFSILCRCSAHAKDLQGWRKQCRLTTAQLSITQLRLSSMTCRDKRHWSCCISKFLFGYVQEPMARLGRLLFPLPLFAYPFYLWQRSPGKTGSHYDPKSDLFVPGEAPLVCALPLS